MKTEIFEVKTGNSEQSLGELRKSLKEAKSELLSLTEGTEEYAAALEKASNAEQTLRDMSETVTRQSKGLEGAMQGLSAGLAGISGATNSVLGVMSMLGVENEELNKKLNQSITALIGVTQGLQAIDPAIKGFKDMNKVIKTVTGSLGKVKIAWMATGLGALVILIGSLIANWDEFSASIGISTDLFDKFGTIVKKTIRAATTVIKNFTQGITQTVAGVVNALKKVVKGDFSGAFDEIKKGFKNAGKEFKEIFTETVSEWGTDLPPKAKEEAKKAGAKVAEKVSEGFQEKLDRELTEWANKYSFDKVVDIILKNVDEKLKEQADIKEILIPVAPDFSVLDKEEELRDRVRELFTNEDGITDWFGVEEFLKQYPTVTEALEEISRRKLEALKTTRKITETENNLAKTISNTTELTGYFGDMMGSLSSIFEENEEAAKAFSIVQAISQTAVGIITALSGTFTTKTGPWDMALAIAQAASVAAAGIAQITNIKNQKIGSQMSAPTVPDVKTSAIQQSNYQGGDYQVYVTETDITDTQNRVRVIENQAKY